MISRSARPITPFIGVRISWLMVARKADLARSAANAVSLAASSSLSASLYAVMLRAVPRISSGRPVSSRSTSPDARTQTTFRPGPRPIR